MTLISLSHFLSLQEYGLSLGKKNRETKFIVYIVHCQKMSLSEDFTEKKRNSSAELVIKKMQIKTTIKFHFTPILTIISNSDKFLDCVGGE